MLYHITLLFTHAISHGCTSFLLSFLIFSSIYWMLMLYTEPFLYSRYQHIQVEARIDTEMSGCSTTGKQTDWCMFDLPSELLLLIFSFQTAKEFCYLISTCRKLYFSQQHSKHLGENIHDS